MTDPTDHAAEPVRRAMANLWAECQQAEQNVVAYESLPVAENARHLAAWKRRLDVTRRAHKALEAVL